ncbi:hypothetical protein [Desulfovibrio cuneatus]|uniref:hypothetical protein n=1 Tax=Desulfovibrio cuneatus TaxID=159728 RepID=UPI0004249496|nr:hypothetical protein [Desulfovibrio cuneatus]
MRTYTIDQLNAQDITAITKHLQGLGLGAGLEGLFWLPVALEHLSPTQQEHAAKCGPYALGLEVTEDALHLELLVRARNAMRCECIATAPPALRQHIMDYLDAMLVELGIHA